jgi:hypothetical protein
MIFFLHAQGQEEDQTNKVGHIEYFEDSDGEKIPFTERNSTGWTNYPDTRVVGHFPDNQKPRCGVFVTNSKVYLRYLSFLSGPKRRTLFGTLAYGPNGTGHRIANRPG